MSWGIRSAPESGAVRPDQRPRACPRFADVAPTYVPRFRRMPHRAASVASTKPRSTNFLTGCSSSARQMVAGARSGDPSVDALGIHRAQAASLQPASGADHAAIVDHRPRHRVGIGRSAPAPDGSWLVRRVSWADLQLHRICSVSRKRSLDPLLLEPPQWAGPSSARVRPRPRPPRRRATREWAQSHRCSPRSSEDEAQNNGPLRVNRTASPAATKNPHSASEAPSSATFL